MKNINDLADAKLFKLLKFNKFINFNKIKNNFNNNGKLEFLFSKKEDYFYEKIIVYSHKIQLNSEIVNEINFFNYCTEQKEDYVINNFSLIRNNLKKYNSQFYPLTALYYMYIEKNQNDLHILFRNIMDCWEENLIIKIINYRMKKICNERKKYYKKIFSKIEILQKKSKILNIFPDYLNYFWENKDDKVHKMNLTSILKYEKYLKNDPIIEQIVFQLGRKLGEDINFFTTLTDKMVEKDVIKSLNDQSENIVGITESANIQHVLPNEIVLLNNPKFNLIFYKKLIEGKLTTFDFESDSIVKDFIPHKVMDYEKLPKNNGDVIICVDSSNSMKGPFEFIAKALTLAITKDILNIRNRNCILINFSENNMFLNVHELINSPNALNLFLEKSFSGGTDIDRVLEKAFEFMQFKKDIFEHIDILLISDFIAAPLISSTVKRIQEFQKFHNKFHAIQIGNEGNYHITNLFNNCWVYDPNDPFTCERFLNNLLEYNNK